ncbi:MAG TPA: polysaccharide biosynthesis C-terminal domain-containing protein, partial [Ktedonobacterales bacterium]|nr:polysaccharide biosynthesis C-terminal domain-containing protein [Ktedonobacterales bacterium]
ARNPEEAGKLTRNALIIQIPLAIILGLLAIEVVSLVDTSLLVIHLTVITAIGAAGAAMVGTCVSGLAGLQNMRVPSFIGLGCATAGTAGIVIGVQLQANIVVLAACGLGAQALNLALLLVYAQTKMRLLGPINFRLWPQLIGGGMPFFAWSVVLLFYGQVDITLTKILAGDTVVGWYAAANRIVSIPIFLPTIVVTAVLPALSHERVPSSPRFRELTSHSLRMVMLAGIPAAVGTVLLADRLVSLLRFPATFAQISPLIVILGINMPLIGLDMVMGTVLIAIGRQKAWTCVGVISAIFNPLANLWAIPYTQHVYGNGAIGAAAVTFATEFIMLVGALVLLPRPLFTWSDVGYIFRCLMAAALMVPAVRAMAGYGAISITLAVIYGAAIYGMAAYILRLFTASDIRGVMQTVQARLGTSGAPFDGRMMADSARRMLANAAQTAAGRIKTISRPLASGAAYVVGSISQPLTSAARQTALRMGGAISRPLSASSRSAEMATDTPVLPRFGNLTGAEANPSGIPPWGLPATAPLPSLAEVLAETDDDEEKEDEAYRAPPPEWPRQPVSERSATNGHGTGTRSHGPASRPRQPRQPRPGAPAPAPVRSHPGSGKPERGSNWPAHPNDEQ